MQKSVAIVAGALLALAMAWPVVVAPTERVFGTEIVGRHHDPYTVMLQMATTGPVAPYVQPLTDHVGWILARVLHPVAAYNLLILLTFPLAAGAAYALARYLSVPRDGAVFAGLVFAFAPVHLAHAAYHAHLAQVQWLPLYFLALFAFIDRPSVGRAGWLLLACASLVLSSFYFGLMGAVLSPIAVVAWWWASPSAPRSWRRLGLAVGLLALAAGGAAGALRLLVPGAMGHPERYAFMAGDLMRYSANWWVYLVPPVDHPVLGPLAAGAFERRGITLGLLEDQLSLGVGLLALAAAGAVLVMRRKNRGTGWRGVAALCVIGAAAFVVSLGPAPGGCHSGTWALACHLYGFVPMFRAYARFGMVVQLAAAVAGGFGLSLLARHSKAGLVGAWCLAAVVAFEYAPVSWRWHDVLPTTGHRWLVDHEARQSLDCMAPRLDQGPVAWLMQRPLAFLGGDVRTCLDPHLGDVLAAAGYSHVVVRRAEPSFAEAPTSGLTLVATFPDSRVFEVTPSPAPLVTMRTSGFSEYEPAGPPSPTDRYSDDWWRWLGLEGTWVLRNTTPAPLHAELTLEASSPAGPRALTVRLDGQPGMATTVGHGADAVVFGPWLVAPGDHVVRFTVGVDAAVDIPDQPGARLVGVRRETWLSR